MLYQAKLLQEAPSYQCFASPVTVNCHFHIIRKWWPSSILVFCLFSCKTNWHKLRKVYWIWQETVWLIHHYVGDLRAELPDVNINMGIQIITVRDSLLFKLHWTIHSGSILKVHTSHFNHCTIRSWAKIWQILRII